MGRGGWAGSVGRLVTPPLIIIPSGVVKRPKIHIPIILAEEFVWDFPYKGDDHGGRRPTGNGDLGADDPPGNKGIC